ncbi:MAG: P-loop ATPase, Sll1717 family, partial [Saprospiraceae bacterium]
QANELFKRLKPGKQELYIFVDELELTNNKTKAYQRDIKLIRDLIAAVYNLNLEIKKNNFKIRLIAGVRSEVVNSIIATGKEINKMISDFGLSLYWHQPGHEISHPLIRIITSRLKYTHKLKNPGIDFSESELWKSYFPEVIKNKPSAEYILHQTWYRPRDMVRILKIAQNHFPEDHQFTNSLISNIAKEYSLQSWTEQVEELNSIYTPEEIEGIKELFYGSKSNFSFGDLGRVSDTKKQFYPKVTSLLGKYPIGKILSDLYRVGVIGNSGNIMRFAFRGDDEVLLEKEMVIHAALTRALSIEFEVRR